MDYIGVNVYCPLTDKNDPTVAEIKTAWTEKGYIAHLERLFKRFNKPIIFTEIGYPSHDGANKQPAGPAGYLTGKTIDLQEQADCYQAAWKSCGENRGWQEYSGGSGGSIPDGGPDNAR